MTDAAPIIHIVDDDESVRTAMARLLGAAGFRTRVYGSAGEFLLQPPEDVPGCVILDVRMPGPSGLDLFEALTKDERSPPVVFLTGHGSTATGVRAMKDGAVDFLEKPVSRDTLLDAIKVGLDRDAERRAARAIRARISQLSARERQVLDGILAGKLNKQIAGTLGTAERTVKQQRANLMRKLGATSVAQLVKLVDSATQSR
jgi:FixJ family two-component response regulator